MMSNPRLLFFERISFLKIPFLNKDRTINIDSQKIDIIEIIRIMNLLVIDSFFSTKDC